MPDIKAGTLYFPQLPKNHPIQKYVEEEKLDMHGQDKLCKLVTDCIDEFLLGLTTVRDEEFEEVANARESSFQGSMLTDDGEVLLLATDPTEVADVPLLVGPDGETLL